MNKTDEFKVFMEKVNYFDRMLNRYQSLPRRYGSDLLLFSSEADLLEEIGDHEPISSTELARLKISTPSAISQIVKKLDSKNLLCRDAQDGNRKTIYLRLSDEGRRIYEYHRRWEEQTYKAYMGELRDYSAADIQKAAGLIDFLSEKYMEEFNALDM